MMTRDGRVGLGRHEILIQSKHTSRLLIHKSNAGFLPRVIIMKLLKKLHQALILRTLVNYSSILIASKASKPRTHRNKRPNRHCNLVSSRLQNERQVQAPGVYQAVASSPFLVKIPLPDNFYRYQNYRTKWPAHLTTISTAR
jgi:hypothetical protein